MAVTWTNFTNGSLLKTVRFICESGFSSKCIFQIRKMICQITLSHLGFKRSIFKSPATKRFSYWLTIILNLLDMLLKEDFFEKIGDQYANKTHQFFLKL